MPAPVLSPKDLTVKEEVKKSSFLQQDNDLSDMPDPVLGPSQLASKAQREPQQASKFGQQQDSMSDAPEPVLSKLDTKKASPIRKSAFAATKKSTSEDDIDPVPFVVERKQKSPLKKATVKA